MAASNIKLKLAKKKTTVYKPMSNKLQRSGGSMAQTPKLKRRGCCGKIR